jgi:hypothetical protein
MIMTMNSISCAAPSLLIYEFTISNMSDFSSFSLFLSPFLSIPYFSPQQHLPAQQAPEMHRVPLEQTCLRVKVLGYPGSLAQVLANVIEARG